MPSDVHVLLVDDEASVRDNLQVYLEDEGFLVTTAASGEEALEVLEQQVFGVAIVDMRLSGMSGNDFIRRAVARAEQLHFIIHTGSLEYQLPEDLQSLGLSSADVLLKPVGDLGELTRRLSALRPALSG
ncbi:MAG: response regulator [Cellvibrionaceae bacterium]